MGAVGRLTEAGISSTAWFLPGLQFVDVARNFIVTEFLQNHSDKTHLFFIDDDVGFSPVDKVVEFINRPEDIVAGIYPLRKDGPPQEYPCMLDFEGDTLKEADHLVKGIQIPMGFTCIRRHVLEALARKCETYSFPHAEEGDKTVYNIFERGPIDQIYMGEDVHFSRKVQEAGFSIWVDPDIDFTHRGSKVWRGRFRNAINEYLIAAFNEKLVPAEERPTVDVAAQ